MELAEISLASRTVWPNERSSNGGIDQIPLPSTRGELWLAGKHAVAPDAEAALQGVKATTIVCLTEAHELAERYPSYVEWLATNIPLRAVWFPIHDLSAPSWETVSLLLHELGRRLDRGERLLMHCAAGFGRAGTIAACLLIQLGLDIDDALRLISACRPMAGPEVGAQRELVRHAAEHANRTTQG